MARDYYVVDLILHSSNAARLDETTRRLDLSINGFVADAVCKHLAGKGLAMPAPPYRRYRDRQQRPRDSKALERRPIFLPNPWRGPLTAVSLRDGIPVRHLVRDAVIARLMACNVAP